jgi:hypothetical protein
MARAWYYHQMTRQARTTGQVAELARRDAGFGEDLFLAMQGGLLGTGLFLTMVSEERFFWWEDIRGCWWPAGFVHSMVASSTHR